MTARRHSNPTTDCSHSTAAREGRTEKTGAGREGGNNNNTRKHRAGERCGEGEKDRRHRKKRLSVEVGARVKKSTGVYQKPTRVHRPTPL